MKKTLLCLATFASMITSAQVTNFNADAFSFELTSVVFEGATANIVDAWTQVAGFQQSDEVARTGTYSMLADFSTTIPAATPKLQTWRTTSGKEGNFNFDSDPASNENYTISGYIYVDVATDGGFFVTSQKSGGQFESASINLSTVTPGVWTRFSNTFDFAETDGADYWSAMNFTTLPTMNAKIYIDDVQIALTSSLSTTYSEIVGASVNASNGDITVNGANLDAVYTITGQKVGATNLNNGVYIVKISKGNKQETIKVVM